MKCPSQQQLAAHRAGADAGITAHVAECATCRSEAAAFARVAELSRSLPVAPSPTASERTRARDRLLLAARETNAAPAQRFTRPVAAAVGLALAASIAALAILPSRVAPTTTSTTSPIYRATLRSHGADWTRTSGQPDEIVSLRDGRITVDVQKLQTGERFRVVTPDGEVEVRGTSFDVTVSDGHLAAVHVSEGRVEVRAEGHATTLEAGDEWEPASAAATPPAVEATPLAVAPASTATPAPARRVAAIEAVPVPSQSDRSAEAAFEEGFAALREGDASAAAGAFERAMALAGSTPLAEDCAFWRAVALARADRDAEARAALASFLSRFPRSPRHGEAAVVLGSMLVEAGDLEGAERRYRAAALDSSPEVRAAALEGLQSVAARKQQ